MCHCDGVDCGGDCNCMGIRNKPSVKQLTARFQVFVGDTEDEVFYDDERLASAFADALVDAGWRDQLLGVTVDSLELK